MKMFAEESCRKVFQSCSVVLCVAGGYWVSCPLLHLPLLGAAYSTSLSFPACLLPTSVKGLPAQPHNTCDPKRPLNKHTELKWALLNQPIRFKDFCFGIHYCSSLFPSSNIFLVLFGLAWCTSTRKEELNDLRRRGTFLKGQTQAHPKHFGIIKELKFACR